MIQIKLLKDMNGMLRNHIYTTDDITAKQLVEHNCIIKSEKNDAGKWVAVGIYGGTGDTAIYYSKDKDDLHNTIAPEMKIPSQLNNCRLLQVGDEKSPFTPAWQKTNTTIKNPDFLKYIIDHEKYGVLCGWDSTNGHFLVVIDFDDEITQREVTENGVLPETFTCKTARKGLQHWYFYVTTPIKKWKILTKEKDTLADIQAESTQVIGPGSRIPDGRCYEVVKDIPIATITPELLHKALDQFNYQEIEKKLNEISADGLTLSDFEKDFGDDKALAEVRSQLKIVDVLHEASISTSRNPTKCPFHPSKGGKSLGFDSSKGIWNCFHCLDHGTTIDLWMRLNNITEFVEAKKKLCEKFNIKDTYVIEKKKAQAVINNNLPLVKLPCKNYTQAEFAIDAGQYFKGNEEIFYKPDEKIIVEITDYEDKLSKKRVVGFSAVDSRRLLNLIEERVNTYNVEYIKKEEVIVRQSANEQHIKILAANTNFINSLYKIRRFLNYPIPFLSANGELIIPQNKTGKGYYDDRFQAYFTPDTPELRLMSIDEAKFLLNDILSEFCFKEELDNTMALAYLITPMCRGLYKLPTNRTPVFIIQASRERSGKDYLAGIRGILYEGQAIDDNPIVTGEKNESGTEELRKKLTSALKIGRRLYHSSNNRGFLNNAVFEQFTTSEIWRDRELGKSVQLELNNEMDVSLSANLGLTFTPDLNHRSRFINLFFSQENPNERKFKRVDLHGYISHNRSTVLSAIYTLISAWVTAGKPQSKTPFTSFPEWARVVGGIMDYHKLGDPCVTVEDTNLGGDKETQSMKELCSFMSIYQLNDSDQPKGYSISSLRSLITEAQSREDIEGFSHWDLKDRSDQVKFGNLIKRFVGREFHCKQQIKFKDKDGIDDWTKFKVTLIIAKDNDKSNRILYGFPTEVEKNKVMPNKEVPELPQAIKEESVEDYRPKPPQLSYDAAKAMISSMRASMGSNQDIYTGTLVERGISDEQIEALILEGILYNVRGGYVRLL